VWLQITDIAAYNLALKTLLFQLTRVQTSSN